MVVDLDADGVSVGLVALRCMCCDNYARLFSEWLMVGGKGACQCGVRYWSVSGAF